MSGTSQDGIDAVLAEFHQGRFTGLLARHSTQYPPKLRAELLELSREATPVSLARYATLDRTVADCFADAALELIERESLEPSSLRAIGSHGQTVFHDPLGAQSTLQLGDPSRIAVRTGLTVVADFRRADIALGGQGAPLVPAFHQALFADPAEPRAVLNLGGIANLTVLPDADPARAIGFDCGPANCLMDEWAERHLGQAYDADGAWAAGGQVIESLLDGWLADDYFHLPAPKSTGRGTFNLDWALARSGGSLATYAPRDVQRSLLELTARSVADAAQRTAGGARRVLVCGGGARNPVLMGRLQQLLAPVVLGTTADLGLDPQAVEATAFAWMACRRLRGEPANLPSVTGARRSGLLGGIYAA